VAPADGAFRPDFAAMTADDALHSGQADAGAGKLSVME